MYTYAEFKFCELQIFERMRNASRGQRYGWVDKNRVAPVEDLPLDHPTLAQRAQKVQEFAESHGIHPRLILNYGQLHRIRYSGQGSDLTTARVLHGQQVSCAKKKRGADVAEDNIGQAFMEATCMTQINSICMFIFA